MNLPSYQLWNSHFVGAYLLWRFVKGYSSVATHGPDLPIVFPVLQLLTTPALLNHVPKSKSKTKTLEDFIVNIVKGREQYLVINLAKETKRNLDWILNSIAVAIATGLLMIDYKNARLEPNGSIKESTKMKGFMEELRKVTGAKAWKFGRWLGALTNAEVMGYLGVSIT